MSYIDAHVHVWTRHSDQYPIADEFKPLDIHVHHYGPEDILTTARRSGISRVVLIQMNFYAFDNSYMLDVIANQPSVFRGVAQVDHASPGVADEMRRLKPLGVRGFRIVGLGSNLDRWLDHPGYTTMFRTAAEERIAICPLMSVDALPALSRMCERFPDTPVVIDHFARVGTGGSFPEPHVDAICAMAKHKNVNMKVSAFYALGAKKPPYDDIGPMIRRVRDAFGAERMMWASDCPFQTMWGDYEASAALVRDRLEFLSRAERELILRGTAERVYFS